MALTASSALFYWDAALKGALPIIGGDPVATRDGSGYFIDSEGKLRKAIVNRPRFEWEDLGDGFGKRPCMLLELARTNRLTYAFALDNAAWTKADVTITTDAAPSADPTMTLDRIVEAATSTTHYVFQSVTFAANTPQSFSVEVAPGQRTKFYYYVVTTGNSVGVFADLSAGTVANYTVGAGAVATKSIQRLANGNFLISFTGTLDATTTIANLIFLLADASGGTTYLGDVTKGLYAGGFQHERDAAFSTSRIVTGASEVTRPTDSFYWKNPPKPQAMAAYLRWVVAEVGVFYLLLAGNNTPAPHFICYQTATTVNTYHDSTAVAGSVLSNVAYTPNIGDVLELVATLFGDGSVHTILSVNGGAAVESARTAAQTLDAAWSAERLWLNGEETGAFTGANKYADIKIVKLADLANTPATATPAAVMSELRNFRLNSAGNPI